MNIETIERLSKVHAELVSNYTTISKANKEFGSYGGSTEVVKAAEGVAAAISREVGPVASAP
jgi:hypothetical protein